MIGEGAHTLSADELTFFCRFWQHHSMTVSDVAVFCALPVGGTFDCANQQLFSVSRTGHRFQQDLCPVSLFGRLGLV